MHFLYFLSRIMSTGHGVGSSGIRCASRMQLQFIINCGLSPRRGIPEPTQSQVQNEKYEGKLRGGGVALSSTEVLSLPVMPQAPPTL